MEFLQARDEGILFWFGTHHWPWLDAAMKGLSFIGDPTGMTVVAVAAALGFLLGSRPRTAAVLTASALLAFSLSETVKHTVNRPRPDVAWRRIARPNQPSFPSGHSLNSMADYGAIALLASRRIRRRAARRLVIAAGLILPLLIGISRPYLGVHYPSDVLAGWIAGLVIALLAYWADLRWGDDRTSAGLEGDKVTS